MPRDMDRARAAWDIREALNFSGGEPLPPQVPAPLPAPLQPHPPMQPGMPQQRPQGALSAPMPQQRPGVSPLQTMQDFKSPPVAAALQGAVGREGPVGFAAGGRVVVRGIER